MRIGKERMRYVVNWVCIVAIGMFKVMYNYLKSCKGCRVCDTRYLNLNVKNKSDKNFKSIRK